MSVKREPNSHECVFFGRKLSNHCLDDVKSDENTYLLVGSENDDEIYFGESLKDGEEMLRERVLVSFHRTIDDNGNECDLSNGFDLEDLLRFAARNCRGIYDRVAKEVIPYDDSEVRA